MSLDASVHGAVAVALGTHVQGHVDTPQEVVGVLLGARRRRSVGAHRFGDLFEIPDYKKK